MLNRGEVYFNTMNATKKMAVDVLSASPTMNLKEEWKKNKGGKIDVLSINIAIRNKRNRRR